MSKMGIGGFFGGFAEGYQSGSKIKREREKAKREEEEFGIRKEGMLLDLAARKREEAFQNDMRESLSPIYRDFFQSSAPESAQQPPAQEPARSAVQVMPVNMGNVEVSPIGNANGIAREPRQTFPPEMETDLKIAEPSSGPPIPAPVAAPGQAQPVQQAQQPRRLNLRELTERFADTSLMIGFKHGKVTLAQLKEARDLRRDMDKEGVTEAIDTWLTTRDKYKTAEVFNTLGKFKFDPETMDIQTVEDPNGVLPANVIVTRPGKDGKPEVVFDYAATRLAGISDEAYTQLTQQGKVALLKEEGDTKRTRMNNETTLKAAAMKDNTRQNPEVSALEKLMNTELEGILKSPQLALGSEEQRIIRADIFSRARERVEGGENAQRAYSMAMREIFKAYGKPLPKEIQQPQPKR
jgi:hypothetical protein